MKTPFLRRDFLKSAALLGASTALNLRRIHAASPKRAASFRPLFDGQTLAGWHAVPRIGIPKSIDVDQVPPGELHARVLAAYSEGSPDQRKRLVQVGSWEVRDGAIVGGQQPAGSGSYLLSDGTFGDFELELEARPDWPIDTGIMVRAHALGSIGFQVNVDHRPNGALGGIYGNSVGNFLAAPFSVDGDEQPGLRVANLRSGIGEPQFPSPKMRFAAPLADFLRVWHPNDWNRFRIRCVGALPVITTWINDAKICELDTATIDTKGYVPQQVKRVLGRAGHIGFEVHDNGRMGRNRWAEGGQCRWRDIRLKELP